MVYTVTFNPAIDYVIHTPKIELGEVNRLTAEEIYYGGKGINVSVVLKELGVASRALGFIAGFTGDEIERGLNAAGIDTDFTRLKTGSSRINVKIRSAQETELNAQGPEIDGEALSALFEKLDALADGDTLILAGSIPGSLPPDIYERILERTSGKKLRVVVDATKDLLLNVLKYKPFLIKPNDRELGEIFGVKLSSIEEIEKYARILKERGAQNVLVSMAGEGALLIDENGAAHRCGVCRGNVRSSVGAGDSMVAGFVAGVLDQNEWDSGMTVDYSFALKLGTAAGGATAFSDGLAVRKKIDELLKQL